MDRDTSSILRLRARWYGFALMAVAYARRILSAKRAGRGEARAQAEMLELCVRAALIDINRDIAEAAQPEEESAEADALAHLKTIALTLLALVVFLTEFKTRCPAGCGINFHAAPFAAFNNSRAVQLQLQVPPFLDSG